MVARIVVQKLQSWAFFETMFQKSGPFSQGRIYLQRIDNSARMGLKCNNSAQRSKSHPKKVWISGYSFHWHHNLDVVKANTIHWTHNRYIGAIFHEIWNGCKNFKKISQLYKNGLNFILVYFFVFQIHKLKILGWRNHFWNWSVILAL